MNDCVFTRLPPHVTAKLVSQLVVASVANELGFDKELLDGSVTVTSGDDVDIDVEKTTHQAKLLLCICGQTLVATSTNLNGAPTIQQQRPSNFNENSTSPTNGRSLFRAHSTDANRLQLFYAKRGDMVYIPPYTSFQLKTFGQTNMIVNVDVAAISLT